MPRQTSSRHGKTPRGKNTGTLALGCTLALSCLHCESSKPNRSPPPTTKAQPASGPLAPEVVAKNPAAIAANQMLRYFAPLERRWSTFEKGVTDAQAELGRKLFFEARLSKSGHISCNSCHVLTEYGVDHRDKSIGHAGRRGRRNAPSVYNAAGLPRLFWDGRAANVEEQAKSPILNELEMAAPNPEFVVSVLASMPEYQAEFDSAFPNERPSLSFDNVVRAIGAFERKLKTPSRFDRFVAGDKAALNTTEQRGFVTFVELGCNICHTGTFLGGSDFERAGKRIPWPETEDRGRAELTGDPADELRFRIPSLRNVAKTAPYFHDGSTSTLPEAVRKMAYHQLGKQLTEAQTKQLVAWLHTLTGDLPARWIQEPELPKSTGTTPAPTQQ